MARYWLYLNGEVLGPFEIEQMIRQRGFSRQTLVRPDDPAAKDWMSPADLPELAHIFKAVEEHQSAPLPPPKLPPKPPSPRPTPKAPAAPAAPVPKVPTSSRASWVWWLVLPVVAVCLFVGWKTYQRTTARQEQDAVKQLVEQVRLPSSSPYGTLGHYLEEKEIAAEWNFQKTPMGLFQVTVSGYPRGAANDPHGLVNYAFEVNREAQSVRAVNSAAQKLLSSAQSPAKAPAPKPKQTPEQQLTEALDERRIALEKGDFNAVWDSFSHRKKTEMARAGISRDGFLRVQNLTYRVESPATLQTMKTKKESDHEMLVLIKQTQPNRPDVFLKQLWVLEDGHWMLDDEEKRSATTPAAETSSPAPAVPLPESTAPSTGNAAPAADNVPPEAPKPKVPVTSLPGLSN